jgi:hypothetical protein
MSFVALLLSFSTVLVFLLGFNGYFVDVLLGLYHCFCSLICFLSAVCYEALWEVTLEASYVYKS